MENLDVENEGFEKEFAIDRIADVLRKTSGTLAVRLSDELIDTCLYDEDELVAGCIVGLEMTTGMLQRKEARTETEQREREHRDNLPGQEKLNYVLEKIKSSLRIYTPSFQREAIQLVIKGQKAPEDWKTTKDTKEYMLGKLEEILDGCNKSFCRKALLAYLTSVLPAIKAEYNEEEEIQKACDEYVALCNGKSAEQVRSMIEILKSSGELSKRRRNARTASDFK